ncbi:MAG TPA: hypothetical protein VNO32_44935 [Candidatus Acidoferrum sp.]|nr:hypothetical protein [Candidatus Acidoferrum sp.]
MDEPKKVGVTFISHDQTSEVLQPVKKPLDLFSAVGIASTSILRRVLSTPTMWSDEFNAVESQATSRRSWS